MNFDSGRAAKLMAAGVIAVTLQGCVAVAFPIAASGLLAGGSRLDDGAEGESEQATIPTTVAADAPVALTPSVTIQANVEPAANESTSAEFVSTEQQPPISATPVEEAFVAPQAVTSAGPVTAPQPQVEAPAGAANQSEAVAVAIAPASAPINIPAPSGSSGIVIPVPQAAPAVAGGTFFDPFFSYASDPTFMRSDARTSAALIDPTALKPDRFECTEGGSVVLIDLDPEEGELFPIDTRSASPALAERLAQLRVKGIGVAWISQTSADRADEVVVALRQSGLDPLGTDEVLLMRYPDERKQTRRDELARNSCLVAMVGDTRSDFHELFEYLLNPRDASALEPLIGEGWFLIPTPLLPERAAP